MTIDGLQVQTLRHCRNAPTNSLSFSFISIHAVSFSHPQELQHP